MVEFIKRLAQNLKLGYKNFILHTHTIDFGIRRCAVDQYTLGHSQQIVMVQQKFLNFAGFIPHIKHPASLTYL